MCRAGHIEGLTDTLHRHLHIVTTYVHTTHTHHTSHHWLCVLVTGGWAESHGRGLHETRMMVDNIRDSVCGWCNQQSTLSKVMEGVVIVLSW